MNIKASLVRTIKMFGKGDGFRVSGFGSRVSGFGVPSSAAVGEGGERFHHLQDLHQRQDRRAAQTGVAGEGGAGLLIQYI